MISYTALGVAYARKFSDIPFCKKIATLCDADNIPPYIRQLHLELSPYFEGRFKAITNLLKKSGCQNVLELASGFSPRGLIMAGDKTINYIEADLPGMLREKQMLLKTLVAQGAATMPRNLRFFPLNVLDRDAFVVTANKFPNGPIAVAHEGLLVYFTHEEKQILANIIHDLLDGRGGVWVTTDILTQVDLMKTAPTKKDQDVIRLALKDTGRDYQTNAFVDMEDAKRFFRDLGFAFTIQTLGETAGEIASSHIGLAEERVQNQLSLNVWELKAV